MILHEPVFGDNIISCIYILYIHDYMFYGPSMFHNTPRGYICLTSLGVALAVYDTYITHSESLIPDDS